MARRTRRQVRVAVRDRRPGTDREPAPGTGHRRESLALVQPDRGLVPLPATARHPGAVPRREPRRRRLASPPLGPADRRRVPQPDAVAFRRRQRAVPDAAPDRPVLRAPALPLRDAAQRAHPLLHRPAGDSRPGAVQPNRRTDGRAAAPRTPTGHPPPQARTERAECLASVLSTEQTGAAPALPRPARGRPLHGLRRLPHRRPPRHRGWPCRRTRRDLRDRDPGQAPALLPDRLRRLLAPDPRRLRARRAGRRRGDRRRRRGGEALRRAGNVGRPGNRAADRHRGRRRRRLAAQRRGRRRRRDGHHRRRAERPRLRCRRPGRRRTGPERRRPARRPHRTDRATPASPARTRRSAGLPRRRTARRLHRVQDDSGLPRAPAARTLRRERPDGPPRAHPLRRRRPGRHGRRCPRTRPRSLQRPRLRRTHPGGDRRRVRGAQLASQRPLPPALRLPVEPLAPGAAKWPPRPLRPGPRRDRASLPERRRPRSEVPAPRHPEGGRDPGRSRIGQRAVRHRRPQAARRRGGPGESRVRASARAQRGAETSARPGNPRPIRRYRRSVRRSPGRIRQPARRHPPPTRPRDRLPPRGTQANA